MHPDIHGLWPALLIPVDTDGVLDTPRALAHAHRMLEAGCTGVTLFGTTGEGPAFTVAERKALLESMLGDGVAASQIMVCTTAMALADAIELGRHAVRLGVHRQLFMPPFYYKRPLDAGVIKAFSQLVEGIADPGLKLLLYHFPAMSSYGFTHHAIQTLTARYPGQVVGLKDSSGDLQHALTLARTFPGLSILVGAENHIAEVMRCGGSGSINGLANVAPRLMRRVIAAPDRVSALDSRRIDALLGLLGLQADLPFVGVYKTLLAEQTGDDQWLNLRAPLLALAPEREQALRQAYRGLGELAQDL